MHSYQGMVTFINLIFNVLILRHNLQMSLESIFFFLSNFHESSFLRVELTIIQHWFGWWIGNLIRYASTSHRFAPGWHKREFWVNIGSGIGLMLTGNTPVSKVHGAYMGPTWVLSAIDGPHACPMNLAIRDAITWSNVAQDLRHYMALLGLNALRWCHNEHDGVSNHQPYDCLFNRLFRRRRKWTSKFRVTGLCERNSLVNGEIPAQIVSNAEMFPLDDVMMEIVDDYWWHGGIDTSQSPVLNSWTHLPLLPHICVSEPTQHWFR